MSSQNNIIPVELLDLVFGEHDGLGSLWNVRALFWSWNQLEVTSIPLINSLLALDLVTAQFGVHANDNSDLIPEVGILILNPNLISNAEGG